MAADDVAKAIMAMHEDDDVRAHLAARNFGVLEDAQLTDDEQELVRAAAADEDVEVTAFDDFRPIVIPPGRMIGAAIGYSLPAVSPLMAPTFQGWLSDKGYGSVSNSRGIF